MQRLSVPLVYLALGLVAILIPNLALALAAIPSVIIYVRLYLIQHNVILLHCIHLSCGRDLWI